MKRYAFLAWAGAFFSLAYLNWGCSGGAQFAGGARWPTRTITYQIVREGTVANVRSKDPTRLVPVETRKLSDAEAQPYEWAIEQINAEGVVKLLPLPLDAPWPGADIVIYGGELEDAKAWGEAQPHVDPATGYIDRVRCIVPNLPVADERMRRAAALHELLHAVGLDHTWNPTDIMYQQWFLQPVVGVTPQARQRLKDLYATSTDSLKGSL